MNDMFISTKKTLNIGEKLLMKFYLSVKYHYRRILLTYKFMINILMNLSTKYVTNYRQKNLPSNYSSINPLTN